jgi:hypothetical protein
VRGARGMLVVMTCGGSGGKALPLLILSLDGLSRQLHAPAALTAGKEKPGTN